MVNVTQQNQTVAWHSIKWKHVNYVVNNLRQRLYRATESGDLKKVRNLQKLILRSQSVRVQSIRKVTTENSGKNTPGMDGQVVLDNRSREILNASLLAHKQPTAQPVKRVFIPKEKGKVRPLGIATITDRCRQVIVQTALEPYWEAKFEATSYGFRPGRGAHDAIQKIFCIARSGKGKPWVLEADIKGAFDNISHSFLMEQLKGFPARQQIEKWLKSGICYKDQFEATHTGVQQGGPISPLLLNITLHGMETELGVLTQNHILTSKSPYAVVRYADDLVVFSKSQAECQTAKIKLNGWLAKRGLALSEEKTRIVHLEEGFDFLGFNVKRYKTKRTKRGTVLLIKPSRKSIANFRQEIRQTWMQVLGWRTVDAIRNLNKKISGWGNYFKISSAKKIFSRLDYWMFKRQERYLYRTHPNKHWYWYRRQYYGTVKGRKDRWVFQDKSSKIYLEKLAWIPIRRHIMVKNISSPDNPKLKQYWLNRQKNKNSMTTTNKRLIWRKQQGKCPVCIEKLDNGEALHIHHNIPRSLGGRNNLDNLSLLHAMCHRQIHSKQGRAVA